jgi:hypothetical protein
MPKSKWPTLKELAHALAEEKRAAKQELLVCALVMPNSWALQTGEFARAGIPDVALAWAVFPLKLGANTNKLAAEVMRMLRDSRVERLREVQPEPPLRPSEIPAALVADDEDDDEDTHPLILEGREAAKLVDTDWEPSAALLKRLREDD